MTIEQVVWKVLVEELADVIRGSVRFVAQQMMEAEVSELVGAELGERRLEDRATYRDGYCPRRWDTRAREIELRIPKLREAASSFLPDYAQALRAGAGCGGPAGIGLRRLSAPR